MCKCIVMCSASLALPLECREEWLNCTMNPLKCRCNLASTGVIMTPISLVRCLLLVGSRMGAEQDPFECHTHVVGLAGRGAMEAGWCATMEAGWCSSLVRSRDLLLGGDIP